MKDKTKNKVTKPASPKAEIIGAAAPKVEEKPTVKTTIDVVGFARGRKVGRREGFSDGRRYIVTIAEGYLAESLKLTSRDALATSDQIPAWWIATLVKAWGVDALPEDMAVKSEEIPGY